MVASWLLLLLVRAGTITVASSGWARHPEPFWFKPKGAGQAWRRVLPLLGGSGRPRAVDRATLAFSLVWRVERRAGITSRGWRNGRCGTAGRPCRSVASHALCFVARRLQLRSIRRGRPPYVRSRAVTALALGNVFLPWLFRAQLTVHSRCARH